ncbi:MAG: hypothetical protein LAT84_02005 [Balneolia bacterium]|nr:hypothetical protein [Balneolia bacterium]
MFVRFLLAFFLGIVALFLLMLPSALRHGWSLTFTITLLVSGVLIGILGMLFDAVSWKNVLSRWAELFR